MNAKFEEILNQVNPEILDSEGMDLVEEGIIDSMMIMQMVSMLESAFEFDFDPEDIAPENFETVNAIWEVVEKYVAEKD